MAQNWTDNWQIDNILTDNWPLYPPIQTLEQGSRKQNTPVLFYYSPLEGLNKAVCFYRRPLYTKTVL